jgi:ribosomal protein L7/L12
VPVFDEQVLLVSPGPRRLDVIVRVRELLQVSLHEAHELVDKGNLIVAEGHPSSRRLYDLRDELQALGAEVKFASGGVPYTQG